MLITIKSFKGGTGKTTLSNDIIRDLDLYYSTNDIYNSVLVDLYNKYLENIKDEHKTSNVLFDAGGFNDENIINVSKASDLIIVVMECKTQSIKSTDILLKNLVSNKISLNKVCLVVNKVKNNKKYLNNYNELKEYYINEKGLNKDKFFMIRESEILDRALDEERTIEQVIDNDILLKRRKESLLILKDMKKLKDYIKSVINK